MTYLGIPESAQYTIEAGRELDALIAYHHYGWRWFARDAWGGVRRSALYPPDTEPWIRWNFYISFQPFNGWPEPDRRFIDWYRCGSHQGYRENPQLNGLPKYSTDVALAITLMEKLMADGWTVTLAPRQFEKDPNDWYKFHGCRIDPDPLQRVHRFSAHASTLPLAICRAALCPEVLALERYAVLEAHE